MNDAAPEDAEIPPRGEVKAPFCLLGNQDFDVFLPIIGTDCFAIYAYFVRHVYRDPKLKHSVRDLSDATGVGVSTVSHSLEILEHLRLVKLTRFGGSRDSECQLLDTLVVANCLGAIYHPATLSYSLAPERIQRLKAEVNALRKRQQGKSRPIVPNGAPHDCGNLTLPVSQRNASVSPAIRQRSARETQTGPLLILKERRNKESPTPTPSHDGNLRKSKDLPDERKTELSLKDARDLFCGVMNDLKEHLVNPSRPRLAHLENSFEEWQQFGFESLGVVGVSEPEGRVRLVLCASDPERAQAGLAKYRKAWDAAVREWFKCEVDIEWQSGGDDGGRGSKSLDPFAS